MTADLVAKEKIPLRWHDCCFFLLGQLLKHKREINKFTMIFLKKAFSSASIISTKKADNKTAKPSKQKGEK